MVVAAVTEHDVRAAADAAYGFNQGRRFEMEQADVVHIMAINRHKAVVTSWSIDHVRAARGCGRRIYGWARVAFRPWQREDRRHWVLARRSVRRPEEISYYIAYCPPGTAPEELIRNADSYPGSRRHIALATQAPLEHRGSGNGAPGRPCRGETMPDPATDPTVMA